jgi:hypothetical protein
MEKHFKIIPPMDGSLKSISEDSGIALWEAKEATLPPTLDVRPFFGSL